jgi:RND superfamily putative drug exporter
MDDETLYGLFGSLSNEIKEVKDGQVKLENGQAKLEYGQAKLEDGQAKLERTLRRAIRLAVQDARRQRKRNAEFDEKMTQLASAQLMNEEGLADLRVGLADLKEGLADLKNTVKTFIDGLQQGNGYGRHD